MLIGQDVLRVGRALQVFASTLDWELFPSSAGSINHGIKLFLGRIHGSM